MLDYFSYFASTPESTAWGLEVTASGRTRVAAGQHYPPRRHPQDHHFSWACGRTLDTMQIVLILSGAGRLETKATGLIRITAPMAFVLLPGVWHRYEPFGQTGWDESWVEVRGRSVDALIKARVFSRQHPVRVGVSQTRMEDALDIVHARATIGNPGFDAERVAGAFSVMAAWESARDDGGPRNHLIAKIRKAERYLAAHCNGQVSIEQAARHVGMAYSHFRGTFRTQTGYSPWQYVLHLRLNRARRMLASSDSPLSIIADSLGFNSSFHLSALFKRSYGISPHYWRRKIREQ